VNAHRATAIETPASPGSRDAAIAAKRRNRFSRAVRRIIATLHRWAESGWAGPAVGSWNTIQGSILPGPADALIVPLGLADPRRVWRLASWAILGSVIGGLIAFSIGRYAFDQIGVPVFRLVGIGSDDLALLDRQFQRHGWLFIIVSTLTPISTKIVCIAAGAFGVPLPHFALALTAGRGGRFLIIATLIRFAGERFNRWLARKGQASAAPPVTGS
jgi:membrane protein YqaA with SNARE-associated domain